MTNENEFTQLCVWPACIVGEDKKDDLINWLKTEFNVRAKYAEEIKTLPTIENGIEKRGTGRRNDLLFYVHSEDIPKFAVQRLQLGIRWWEDVVSYNDPQGIYPNEVLNKYKTTW